MVLNLRREPGVLFDLIFIFSATLNPEEVWLHDLVLNPRDKDSMRLIRSQLMKAPKVPQEMKIFAHFKENTRHSVLNELRDRHILKREIKPGLLERYRAELAAKELHKTVWQFYFGGDFPASPEERGKIIDGSLYDLEMRYLMFSYFSRPEEYQKKLLKAWDGAKAYYESIYQKRAEDVMTCLQLVEEKDLRLMVKNMSNGPIAFEKVKWSWISVSLFNPHMIWLDLSEGGVMLGWKYQRTHLEEYMVSDTSIVDFFDVMGSEQRRKIIYYLARRGWVSTREIAEELGLQEGPTVRHLLKIYKIRVLLTKRVGREKVYYLDKKQFEKYLLQALEFYVKRGRDDLDDESFSLKRKEGF